MMKIEDIKAGLRALPLEMSPAAERVFFEAVGDKAYGVCLRRKESRDESHRVVMELVKEVGALGYYPPSDYAADGRVNAVLFPCDRNGDVTTEGFVKNSWARYGDIRPRADGEKGYVQGFRPSKTKNGKALAEKFQELPTFQDLREVEEVLGLPKGGLSYDTGTESGHLGGTLGNKIFFPGMSWFKDANQDGRLRFFYYNMNTNAIIQENVAFAEGGAGEYSDRYRAKLEAVGGMEELLAWRPDPSEWRMTTELQLRHELALNSKD